MKRISNLLQATTYMALLAGLILALILVFRAASGGGNVPAATAPLESPSPAPQETATLPATLPAETPTSPWPTYPPGFTPSPTTTPTPTPEGTVTDLGGHFRLTLLPGCNAFVGRSVTIYNFDTATYDSEEPLPPGGMKIQIGVGQLSPGQTFDQWVADWIALEKNPDHEGPDNTVSEPLPYKLGQYEGVTFTPTDATTNVTSMEIVLASNDARVLAIGLRPADPPALAEALIMLSSLEILPDPSP